MYKERLSTTNIIKIICQRQIIETFSNLNISIPFQQMFPSNSSLIDFIGLFLDNYKRRVSVGYDLSTVLLTWVYCHFHSR
jgi:hypothetical protein